MLIIHLGLSVLVANKTSENGEVLLVGMARLATLPLALVPSIENGEKLVVVVEGRIVPVSSVMTVEAIRGEALAAMLLLIIGLMTAKTIVLVYRIEEQREVRRRRMAGVAWQRLVCPDQCKTVG